MLSCKVALWWKMMFLHCVTTFNRQSKFVSHSVYLSFHSVYGVYTIIYTLHYVYSLYCTMNSWWETVIGSLCPWCISWVIWDIKKIKLGVGKTLFFLVSKYALHLFKVSVNIFLCYVIFQINFLHSTKIPEKKSLQNTTVFNFDKSKKILPTLNLVCRCSVYCIRSNSTTSDNTFECEKRERERARTNN